MSGQYLRWPSRKIKNLKIDLLHEAAFDLEVDCFC